MLRMVVGLGNPPPKYQETRHNVGYKVLYLLLENFKLQLKAGKGDHYFSSLDMNDREVYLVKPSTYINESGLAVLQAKEKFGVSPAELLVVCDDFNLPLGKLRLKEKGSEGGHNGMRSIIYHLNTQDFPRLRLGIGAPAPGKSAEEYVLEKFDVQEKKTVAEMLEKAAQAVITVLSLGLAESMQRFN